LKYTSKYIQDCETDFVIFYNVSETILRWLSLFIRHTLCRHRCISALTLARIFAFTTIDNIFMSIVLRFWSLFFHAHEIRDTKLIIRYDHMSWRQMTLRLQQSENTSWKLRLNVYRILDESARVIPIDLKDECSPFDDVFFII